MAGLEALAFGVLVFVFGTLVLVNGWAVVDAKFATNGAAREAVRAVVTAPPAEGGLLDIAQRAAGQAVAAHGHAPDAVTVEVVGVGSLAQQRCAPVRLRASLEVRAALLPGIAVPVATTVSSVHEEVIDPFRTGFDVNEGLERDDGGNPCGF